MLSFLRHRQKLFLRYASPHGRPAHAFESPENAKQFSEAPFFETSLQVHEDEPAEQTEQTEQRYSAHRSAHHGLELFAAFF